MERKEISKQIGALNLKISLANKELEEMEIAIKRKKIEIRKYKNDLKGLQLRIEEIEIEKWREKKAKTGQIKSEYIIASNNDYYSQEKKFYEKDRAYIDYMKKNVLPYND